jgi:hypothetical protein
VARLGEFGREELPPEQEQYVAPEPDVFMFHGEEFTLPAAVSALPLLRFAAEARILDGETKRLARAKGRARTEQDRYRNLEWEAELTMREQAGLYDYLRAMLTESEWERFSEVAQSVAADVPELMGVANKIIAAVTSRPTQRPGTSSAGPLTTTTGSPASSPSPGGQPPLPPDPGDTYTVAPITQQPGQASEPQPSPAPETATEPQPVTDAEVARALGISEREAQMQRWRAEMVPPEEVGSLP